MSSRIAIAILAAAALCGQAWAADPDSCKTVKFSDVGWTDITATYPRPPRPS